MDIGENIKTARLRKKLTQRQLVDILHNKYSIDIKNNTISNWENGISNPSIDMIYILCEVLDVDANFMFGWEEFKNESIKEIENLDEESKILIENLIEKLKE